MRLQPVCAAMRGIEGAVRVGPFALARALSRPSMVVSLLVSVTVTVRVAVRMASSGNGPVLMPVRHRLVQHRPEREQRPDPEAEHREVLPVAPGEAHGPHLPLKGYRRKRSHGTGSTG